MGSEISDYYHPEDSSDQLLDGQSLSEPLREVAGLKALSRGLVRTGDLLSKRDGQVKDLLGLDRKLAGVGEEVPPQLQKQADHLASLEIALPRTEAALTESGFLPENRTVFVRPPRNGTGK